MITAAATSHHLESTANVNLLSRRCVTVQFALNPAEPKNDALKSLFAAVAPYGGSGRRVGGPPNDGISGRRVMVKPNKLQISGGRRVG